MVNSEQHEYVPVDVAPLVEIDWVFSFIRNGVSRFLISISVYQSLSWVLNSSAEATGTSEWVSVATEGGQASI